MNELEKIRRGALFKTQPEMAKALGVNLFTFVKWEKGNNKPYPKNLERLISYLENNNVPRRQIEKMKTELL